MDSLIFIITLIFLIAGIAYGIGAGTIKSSNDAIAGVTKTFAGLASLIFLLLIISQFIGLFNYTNMPNVLAVTMAGWLEHANIGTVPLLIGFILVITVLDLIIPGSMPKWAIFAPVFVPLFVQLGVTPQTVLAAYRVGDSPMNVITPLMVYFPFIVMVAQRYQKDVGIGTIISLDAALHCGRADPLDHPVCRLVPAGHTAGTRLPGSTLAKPPQPQWQASSCILAGKCKFCP